MILTFEKLSSGKLKTVDHTRTSPLISSQQHPPPEDRPDKLRLVNTSEQQTAWWNMEQAWNLTLKPGRSQVERWELGWWKENRRISGRLDMPSFHSPGFGSLYYVINRIPSLCSKSRRLHERGWTPQIINQWFVFCYWSLDLADRTTGDGW